MKGGGGRNDAKTKREKHIRLKRGRIRKHEAEWVKERKENSEEKEKNSKEREKERAELNENKEEAMGSR